MMCSAKNTWGLYKMRVGRLFEAVVGTLCLSMYCAPIVFVNVVWMLLEVWKLVAVNVLSLYGWYAGDCLSCKVLGDS